MNETPASDQEIEDAIRKHHEERAGEGVAIARAFADVAVEEGIATVTYDPALTGAETSAWLASSPYENLAQFASLPLSWSTPESTRLRISTVRVETFLADKTPLGALENAGIRALNSLDK